MWALGKRGWPGGLPLVARRAARNCGSWLFALSLRKPLAASSMAAVVQRRAIEASRQRLTLRQTRRTDPSMFSMMLVQARDRRSSLGSPSLTTATTIGGKGVRAKVDGGRTGKRTRRKRTFLQETPIPSTSCKPRQSENRVAWSLRSCKTRSSRSAKWSKSCRSPCYIAISTISVSLSPPSTT